MKTPIEMMMDGVDWVKNETEYTNTDLPYVTHSGVVEILGKSMKCYRLSTGQAIFDAADFEAFFADLDGTD